MSWPLKTTSEDRKKEREAGYNHGLKGNDVKTSWSGKEYYKGARAGYEKFRQNQKDKKSHQSHNPSYTGEKRRGKGKNRSSYSGGGGGGYSGSGVGCGAIIIVVVVIFIIIGIVTDKSPSKEEVQKSIVAHQAAEKQEVERVNEFKTSLPAGLTSGSNNFVEIYNQSGSIYIPFNNVEPPNTTYHIYNRTLNGSNVWEEIPVETINIQQMKPSGEWRVILGVKHFMSFGSDSAHVRTIVTWDESQQSPTNKEQTNEQSSIERQRNQERQNKEEVAKQIRDANNGKENNFRNNPLTDFDATGL